MAGHRQQAQARRGGRAGANDVSLDRLAHAVEGVGKGTADDLRLGSPPYCD